MEKPRKLACSIKNVPCDHDVQQMKERRGESRCASKAPKVHVRSIMACRSGGPRFLRGCLNGAQISRHARMFPYLVCIISADFASGNRNLPHRELASERLRSSVKEREGEGRKEIFGGATLKYECAMALY